MAFYNPLIFIFLDKLSHQLPSKIANNEDFDEPLNNKDKKSVFFVSKHRKRYITTLPARKNIKISPKISHSID
jgi:hypothetical protein